jgi:hypothetical protein
VESEKWWEIVKGNRRESEAIRDSGRRRGVMGCNEERRGAAEDSGEQREAARGSERQQETAKSSGRRWKVAGISRRQRGTVEGSEKTVRDCREMGKTVANRLDC